jgi:hypothetical protein
VKLSLGDYPYLGKCRVQIAFKRGSQSRSWHWDLDSWTKGEEKTFSTPAGGLPYDPDTMEVVLSFPRTNYRPRWELRVNR